MSGQMDLPAFRELTPETRGAQRAFLESPVARRPRRRAILALALGVAVAAAAPTLAFHRQLVDFATGDPAPERIQRDFDFLREHSVDANARFGSPRITPEGPAREVMRVTIDGESRPLWVVPTAEGGFCSRMHFMGDCRIPGHGDTVTFGAGGLCNPRCDGWAIINGRVLDRRVEEVVLVYQDGERTTLPYVWVSPPIDAGFFAVEVPDEHREPGRLTAALLGLDDDGNEIAKQCLPLSPDAAEASVAEVRELCPPRPRPTGVKPPPAAGAPATP